MSCVHAMSGGRRAMGWAAGGPWGGAHPSGLGGRSKCNLSSASNILPSPNCGKSRLLLGPPEGTPLTISFPCSRPGPALPRPSLTSQPRTPHSSASAGVTSSKYWSAWTPTGGGAGSVGALASSHGATSSRCTSDQSGAQGAESASPLSTRY